MPWDLTIGTLVDPLALNWERGNAGSRFHHTALSSPTALWADHLQLVARRPTASRRVIRVLAQALEDAVLALQDGGVWIGTSTSLNVAHIDATTE